MSWTDDQWSAFCAVLRRAFAAKEPLSDADAQVYRLLLEDYQPEQVVRAVKRLVAKGQELRPRPGGIVKELQCDPAQPTFDEAYMLIYGRGGLLATAGHAGAASPAQLVAERTDVHPLVRAFVQRKGIDYLRYLPLGDEQWGPKRREELRRDWEAHVAALEARSADALVGPRRGGLRALDPIAVAGLERGN